MQNNCLQHYIEVTSDTIYVEEEFKKKYNLSFGEICELVNLIRTPNNYIITTSTNVFNCAKDLGYKVKEKRYNYKIYNKRKHK